MKRQLVTHIFQEEGAGDTPQSHAGEAPSLPGGRRGEGTAWATALTVASVGDVRRGRVSRLRIG